MVTGTRTVKTYIANDIASNAVIYTALLFIVSCGFAAGVFLARENAPQAVNATLAALETGGRGIGELITTALPWICCYALLIIVSQCVWLLPAGIVCYIVKACTIGYFISAMFRSGDTAAGLYALILFMPFKLLSLLLMVKAGGIVWRNASSLFRKRKFVSGINHRLTASRDCLSALCKLFLLTLFLCGAEVFISTPAFAALI